MDRRKRSQSVLWLVGSLMVTMGCWALVPDKAGPVVDVPVTDAADILPSVTAAEATDAAPASTATALEATLTWPDRVFDENGVRICEFIPGESVPVALSPEEAHLPTPTPMPAPTFEVDPDADPANTASQMAVFGELRQTIEQDYVDPNFVADDWPAIASRYEALINEGLDEETFYDAMHEMIYDLGDEHSDFLDPEEVQEEEDLYSGLFNFVGLGVIGFPGETGEESVVAAVFPDSAATDANLRPHDVILAVDGLSTYDENDLPRTLGEEGTEMTLTIQRPGQLPRNVTVIRRRVSSQIPVDYCLIRGTRIGYLMLPWFDADNIDDEAIAAMEHMTADGPLDGLILDNRVNSGGYDDVMKPVLSMFLSGRQGHYVNRDGRYALELDAMDIGGSQSVPLVVLIGRDSVSNGEISSGLLGITGRATLIGETTLGNVEHLFRYDLSDGSQVYLATETFEPPGLSAGIWEETGIVPDIEVLAGWQYFTEATDPGIAAALDFLMGR